MKKISFFLLFLSISVTEVYSKECHIYSSPPDYSSMSLVSFDAKWQSIPVVGGNPAKFNSFNDAYKHFLQNLEDYVKKECKKNKLMKGIVNLTIQHNTTKEWYHFSAMYDVYQ